MGPNIDESIALSWLYINSETQFYKSNRSKLANVQQEVKSKQ